MTGLDMLEMDLGLVYAGFALFAALGAIWMMQRTTADAGFGGKLPVLKLAHRVMFAITSITMFTSAMDTIYYDSEPRIVDFAVQVILIGVLSFSALRHMAAAPSHSDHNQPLHLHQQRS